MTIVRPLDFNILSNTAPKDIRQIWNKSITYRKDEVVQYKGLIYTSASDDDKHETPDKYASKWVKTGSVNELCFMDDELSTQTQSKTSFILELMLAESFDTIALLNINLSKAEFFINDTLIHKRDFSYRTSRTWWEFFFNKVHLQRDAYIFLPNAVNGKLKIKFYEDGSGANVGHLLIGKKEFVGISVYPANFTYANYSKTHTNEWGYTSISKGRKAKFLEFIVAIEKKDFGAIDDIISSIYDTKALFIGDENEQGYSKFTTFGFLKDYSVPFEIDDYLQYKLNIQGLI